MLESEWGEVILIPPAETIQYQKNSNVYDDEFTNEEIKHSTRRLSLEDIIRFTVACCVLHKTRKIRSS